MKHTLLLLLSAALSLSASDQKTESRQIEKAARKAIFDQLVHPVTPPAPLTDFLSRVGPLPTTYFAIEVLGENAEVPGEFSFRVREHHRVVGRKPHPREGLIVYSGYYEGQSGTVYVLDRQAAKHVPAARHPRVIAGKQRLAERLRLQLGATKEFNPKRTRP